MRSMVLHILLSVIIGFSMSAEALPKKKPLLKINQIFESNSQKSFLMSSSCKPLALIKQGQSQKALECAIKLKHTPLIKALRWNYYIANSSNASFEEITAFIKKHPNFPDQDKLREIAEKKIKDSTNVKILQRWCDANTPQTGNAAMHCLRVLPKTKDAMTKVSCCIKLAWAKQSFSKPEEKAFYIKHKDCLDEQDHINRLNYMLSKERKLSSLPLNELDQEHQHLFKIKLDAVTNGHRNNKNLFDSISERLKLDPHLLYLRAQWYVLRKNNDKLAALLIKYANVRETQGDQWFKIRSLLVWDLLDAGQYKKAYKIAANINYADPSNFVDGEWLAGRIAYFSLGDPSLAYNHFQNILNNSKYSISRAKGAYWSGVATMSLNQQDLANKYFKTASKYLDTFYGQMAIMKLNGGNSVHHTLPDAPEITQQDVQWFKNNELLIISHIFADAGKDMQTRKFIRAALATADTPGKKYLIARFGKHVAVNMLSTISGKEVARGGDLFIEYSYPVIAMDPDKITIERALAHSIIRQESEFNANAKSHAGAIGLMQLMQGTAKRVAKTKQQINAESLKNAEINILLGSKHLGQLIEGYGGSYVLAIAAYNAGEGNVNKWIKKNGDPRKFKDPDQVIEWIEAIPFVETRGYVQYILSNLQIYRNLLLKNPKASLKTLHVDLHKDLLLRGA